MLNRELGQLEFNRRVLAQAADPDVPLLERLRFLCIVSSNLDEFFEIRVAGLKAQIDDGADIPGPTAIPPSRGVPRGLASGPRDGRDAVRAVQRRLCCRCSRKEGIRFLRAARLDAASSANGSRTISSAS